MLVTKAEAADVMLAWNANEEPDLAGYVLYGRVGSSTPYEYIDTYPEEELSNPLNPMASVTDLTDDTVYYFAVTAYDTNGNESALSNEVCVENGIPCQNSALTDGDSSSGSGDGSGGSTGGSARYLTGSGGDSGGGGGGGACFIASAAPMFRVADVLKIFAFFAFGLIGLSVSKRM